MEFLRLVAVIAWSYAVVVVIIWAYVGSSAESLAFPAAPASDCQEMPCSADDPTCCSYTVLDGRLGELTNVTFSDDANGPLIHAWAMVNETDPAGPGGNTSWLNILYHHGSGANIAAEYRQQRYEYYLGRGRVRLFVYDYQGYGKSEGDPSTEGLHYSASNALLEMLSMWDLTVEEVTVLGRSMGGGVAVWQTTQADGLAGSAAGNRGLILQSTFTTYADAAASSMDITGWVVRLGWPADLDSVDTIGDYNQCLFHSHSRSDEWVPFKQAEELEEAATGKRAGCSEFVALDNWAHDDPISSTEKAALTPWLESQRTTVPV